MNHSISSIIADRLIILAPFHLTLHIFLHISGVALANVIELVVKDSNLSLLVL
jgi:hypothetical protein